MDQGSRRYPIKINGDYKLSQIEVTIHESRLSVRLISSDEIIFADLFDREYFSGYRVFYKFLEPASQVAAASFGYLVWMLLDALDICDIKWAASCIANLEKGSGCGINTDELGRFLKSSRIVRQWLRQGNKPLRVTATAEQRLEKEHRNNKETTRQQEASEAVSLYNNPQRCTKCGKDSGCMCPREEPPKSPCQHLVLTKVSPGVAIELGVPKNLAEEAYFCSKCHCHIELKA